MTPLWVYGVIIVIIYSPVMWVRELAYFSKGYIVAFVMMMIAVVTTSYFALTTIKE